MERKTTSDFVSSIMDKRLFSQIKDLKENFEKPVLIIEGKTLYGTVNPNIIRGVISSIAVDWGIPMIWTDDAADTAGMLYWIAKKEQIDEQRPVALRDKRKKESVAEKQEFLISGLPNVSIVLSKRMLKHFKTVKNIFNAEVAELKEIGGIGEEKAKKIVDVIEAEYEGE